MPDGTYAVALHIRDEAALRGLAAKLSKAGIKHHLVIEDDEPYHGQAMALGIVPTDRKILKPFLSSYALVAQSGRALGVMTQEVSGSNPAGRANQHAPVAQR